MPQYHRKYLRNVFVETNRLVLFRNILEEKLVKKVRHLIFLASREDLNYEEIESYYYAIYSGLIENARQKELNGDLWKNYLLWLIATNENPFTRTCERLGEDKIDENLYTAAIHDIKILKDFFDFNFQSIFELVEDNNIKSLPGSFNFVSSNSKWNTHYIEKFSLLKKAFVEDLSPEELVDNLSKFYKSVGCGKMGLYTAFRWLNGRGLVGITNPDSVTFDDLIGYERQKETLIENTEAFVNGKAANNILLYGVRGTGKSSSIKALLNKYSTRGLRLVEVPKSELAGLPEILQYIRQRAQKFIIFIDDLSFESYETEYKHLKALMEGGIQAKPDNVLIYATSNRKHLVQEKWSDRNEMEDEIHISDSVEEKLSLADRFGIIITYTSPDQEEYLKIVEGLAEKYNINMPSHQLREKALQWERWYNARSGRTARQFINHLLGTEA
ncbi:MAG: uncharacterized protein PWQ96_1986 [Clostridia bacterium]|nr:uncharacterized protein [Clostridia bacterium]